MGRQQGLLQDANKITEREGAVKYSVLRKGFAGAGKNVFIVAGAVQDFKHGYSKYSRAIFLTT